MSQSFANQICLVTGAGTGIGAATAELMAARGAAVAVVGLPSDPLEDTVGRIVSAGGTAISVPADVSDGDQMRDAVDRVVAELGTLTLAVNAAGIAGPTSILHDDPAGSWEHVIGINLSGIYQSIRAELPAMIDAGGGSIVNIASVMATTPLPAKTAYNASKSGVVGLTRSAAKDYATFNIRINALSPGVTNTPMLGSNPASSSSVLTVVPMGRMAEPIEMARCAAFLLSDEASYVTGAELVVDGGQLLHT